MQICKKLRPIDTNAHMNIRGAKEINPFIGDQSAIRLYRLNNALTGEHLFSQDGSGNLVEIDSNCGRLACVPQNHVLGEIQPTAQNESEG
jgi:hypothetical protein